MNYVKWRVERADAVGVHGSTRLPSATCLRLSQLVALSCGSCRSGLAHPAFRCGFAGFMRVPDMRLGWASLLVHMVSQIAKLRHSEDVGPFSIFPCFIGNPKCGHFASTWQCEKHAHSILTALSWRDVVSMLKSCNRKHTHAYTKIQRWYKDFNSLSLQWFVGLPTESSHRIVLAIDLGNYLSQGVLEKQHENSTSVVRPVRWVFQTPQTVFLNQVQPTVAKLYGSSQKYFYIHILRYSDHILLE